MRTRNLEKEKEYSKILLARVNQNEAGAAESLVERYWFRIVSLAKKRIYSSLQAKVDADDIAQESFAAFFEKARRQEVYWEKPGDLWRLLASIAIHKLAWHSSRYHTAKRSLQRESDAAHLQVDELASELSENHEAVVDFADMIETTIAREKPLMRSMIRMLLAGYTTDQISRKLDRSPRTVRRLIKSLRARLADQYSPAWLSGNDDSRPGKHESRGAVVPTVSIDDYHLHRMTGQGRYSRVFLAEEIATGSKCAVKVIRKRWVGVSDVESLMRSEVEILSQLDSPYFPQIYGVGQIAGTGNLFLVGELVRGQSLDALVQETNSVVRLSECLLGVARAMSELHVGRVVHGDLKPAHIIISAPGKITPSEKGAPAEKSVLSEESLPKAIQVKIVDFGFAGTVSNPSSVAGGTGYFMAPELTDALGIRAKNARSLASDVFAFGKTVEAALDCLSPEQRRLASALEGLVVETTRLVPEDRPAFERIVYDKDLYFPKSSD